MRHAHSTVKKSKSVQGDNCVSPSRHDAMWITTAALAALASAGRTWILGFGSLRKPCNLMHAAASRSPCNQPSYRSVWISTASDKGHLTPPGQKQSSLTARDEHGTSGETVESLSEESKAQSSEAFQVTLAEARDEFDEVHASVCNPRCSRGSRGRRRRVQSYELLVRQKNTYFAIACSYTVEPKDKARLAPTQSITWQQKLRVGDALVAYAAYTDGHRHLGLSLLTILRQDAHQHHCGVR